MKTLHWKEELNNLGKNGTPCFFIIDYKGTNAHIFPLSEIPKGIQFSFLETNQTTPEPISIEKYPVAYEKFKKSFDSVFSYLENGEVELVNLTFQTEISPVSLKEVYEKAKAKYKIIYNDEWVCFSPEIFVKIEENQIKTYPMKGTISASLPDAASILLNNQKEIDEHHKVVNLLSDDLKKVATDVHTTKFRYIDVIEKSTGNLLQTSSEIVGNLPENWQSHLGDIFSNLLPGGSISGAPKEKTLSIIEQAETYDRGFYTGIAGIFDGNSVDSCVLIRFIEQINQKFYYKSGAGITAKSNPQDEYNEIIEKIYIPN
jgi:uncharacterized pabA-like protein HI_1170